MTFHATLTTQPTVAATASKVASLLATELFLTGVLRVRNEENIPLFRFQWTSEFDSLFNRLVRTMVCLGHVVIYRTLTKR